MRLVGKLAKHADRDCAIRCDVRLGILRPGKSTAWVWMLCSQTSHDSILFIIIRIIISSISSGAVARGARTIHLIGSVTALRDGVAPVVHRDALRQRRRIGVDTLKLKPVTVRSWQPTTTTTAFVFLSVMFTAMYSYVDVTWSIWKRHGIWCGPESGHLDFCVLLLCSVNLSVSSVTVVWFDGIVFMVP